MDRRGFITAAGLTAGSAVASSIYAKDDHSHHHGKKAKERKITSIEKKLIEITRECDSTGKICIAHCLRNLEAGNTSMAECQMAVQAMLPVVAALHSNVSFGYGSKKNMKQLAETCISFCKACKKTCEPHIKHHKECAECAKSCDDCISVIKKYMAA